MLRFIVFDNGKGIPAAQVPIALSRFGQLQPSVGSGLGLAIVDEVARRHGGSIRFDPVDEGTRIVVQIPRDG